MWRKHVQHFTYNHSVMIYGIKDTNLKTTESHVIPWCPVSMLWTQFNILKTTSLNNEQFIPGLVSVLEQ